MEIITGKTGSNHVKAEDDRALHAATFGTGMYVLDVGSKFAISSSTTSSLTLSDGELMLQGCHARIRHGENESLLFANGAAGENRIDLVVAKYKKEAGIESMKLVLYEGDRTTGTPTIPSYVEGNILEGAEEVDMPLYKITVTGLQVTITPLFTIATGLGDVYRKNETYTKNEVNSMGQELQTNINTATQKLLEHSETIEELVNDVGHANEACNDLQDNIDYVYNKLCIPIGCGIISTSDIDATVFQYGNWTTYTVTLGASTYNLHIRIS